MALPKKGMYYEDCKTRIKRIERTVSEPGAKTRLQKSLLNQAELHQKGASSEIIKELTHRGQSFSGAGTKQIGYGPGKKSGTGRWRYEDGQWRKV